MVTSSLFYVCFVASYDVLVFIKVLFTLYKKHLVSL